MPNFDIEGYSGTQPAAPVAPSREELEELERDYSPGPPIPDFDAGYLAFSPKEVAPVTQLMEYFMKARKLGLDPLLAGRIPQASETYETVDRPPPKQLKRMAGIGEQDRRAYSNYMDSVDKRHQLVGGYLQEHPAIAAAYMEAASTGDQDTRFEIEDAITEELAKVYGNMNDFEITPAKVKPVTKLPSYMPGGFGFPSDPILKDAIEPARKGKLGKAHEEMLYQRISEGAIGNLWAKPSDKENYLPDEFVNFYAGMIKTRSPDFTKHKHHKAIRQRLGEQLAAMGEGFGEEGWLKEKEFVRGMIPFGEQGLFPPEELERREKVRYLMDLADESTLWPRIGGKIGGILLTAGVGYAQLTRMGLTSFIGSNARPVASLMATLPAELLVDAGYNPDGYSMFLGSLLDEDQNRIVSGVESMILGTVFNLGIDAWRVLKGKRVAEVNEIMAGELAKELDKKKVFEQFRKMKRFHMERKSWKPPTAVEVVNAPVSNMPMKLLPVSPETQASITRLAETTEVARLSRIHEMEEALDNVNTMITRALGKKPALKPTDLPKRLPSMDPAKSNAPLTPSALKPKDLDLVRKQLVNQIKVARNDRPRLPRETQEAAHATVKGFMEAGVSMEARARIKAHQEKIGLREDPYAPPPLIRHEISTGDDVMKMLGNTLPESSAMDLEALAKATKAEEPFHLFGISRSMAREALRREIMPQLGLAMFSGTWAMSNSDKNKAGAFFAGMMLPLSGPAAVKGLEAIQVAGKGIKSTWVRTGDYLGYTGVPLFSTTKRLAPPVYWGMLQNSFRKQMETFHRQEKLAGFFDHMNDMVKRGNISEETKTAIYDALSNGRRDWVLDEFRRIDSHRPKQWRGVTENLFLAYEDVFRKFAVQADEVGFEMGHTTEFFPRKMKKGMHDEFLKEIGQFKGNVIERAWAKWAKDTGKNASQLTDVEKAHIANITINSRGWKVLSHVSKAGHTMPRVFKEIPPEFRKFYEPLDVASISYVNTMTAALENHRFLGQGMTARWLDDVIEVAPGVKDVSPIKQLQIGPQKRINQMEGTIGDRVTKMMEGHKPLSDAQMNHLVKRLHQFYVKPTGAPMGGFGKFLRDVGYSMMIGNPYSTMTQISDVLLSASLNTRGMGGSMLATAVRRLTGNKLTYTLDDFGIDPDGLRRLLAEFEDEGFMTKWLQRNLKATGFTDVDKWGKASLMDNSLYEMRAAALAPNTPWGRVKLKALQDEFAPAMGGVDGDEYQSFLKALRLPEKEAAKNWTVKSAIFSRLVDQAPIVAESMPLGYSKHPKFRLMYMLKSFTVKQLDLVRQRFWDEIKLGYEEGGKSGVIRGLKGVKDLARYGVLFGGGQLGIQSIKDMMLNRKVEISDRAVSWAAQSIGLHRMYFHMFKDIWADEGPGDPSGKIAELVAKFFLPAPAAAIADRLWPDFSDYLEGSLRFDEPRGEELRILGVPTKIPDKYFPFLRGKTWRYLPGFGNDIWWSIGGGRDLEAKRGKVGPREKPMFPRKPSEQPRFPRKR